MPHTFVLLAALVAASACGHPPVETPSAPPDSSEPAEPAAERAPSGQGSSAASESAAGADADGSGVGTEPSANAAERTETPPPSVALIGGTCRVAATHQLAGVEQRVHGIATATSEAGPVVVFPIDEHTLRVHRFDRRGAPRGAPLELEMSRARFLTAAAGVGATTLLAIEAVCNDSRYASKCLYLRSVGDDGTLGEEVEHGTGMWLGEAHRVVENDVMVWSGAPMYAAAAAMELTLENGAPVVTRLATGEGMSEGHNPYVHLASAGPGRSVVYAVDGPSIIAEQHERRIRGRRVRAQDTVRLVASDAGYDLLVRGRADLAIAHGAWGETGALSLTTTAVDALPAHLRERVHLEVTHRNGHLLLVRRGPGLEPIGEPFDVGEARSLRADVGALYDTTWTGEGLLAAWVAGRGAERVVEVRFVRCTDD